MKNNEEKVMLVCRISKDTKRKLKIYAVMNEITVQDTVDKILKTYLETFTGGKLK
jgi:hypothetical protein|nr:MAG TPA: hypothetical protein [Caudoviricetes sp.]